MEILERILWHGLMALLALCGAGIAIVVAYGIYDALTAETFSLRKDSWECTASHREEVATTTMIPVGKVSVPQTTYSESEVCDRYERRKTHGE